MPGKRRKGPNLPGVKVGGTIGGNQYRFERQPDEFIINNRRVRGGNIGVEGSTTHVHVHTGRPRRILRRNPRSAIDFEGERRVLAEKIAERTKLAQGLFLTREKVDEKTKAFAANLHPVKTAIGFWNAEKKRPATFKEIIQSWNPLNPKGAWWLHPIKTVASAIPLKIFGVGRHSTAKQIRTYRGRFEKSAGRIREINAETLTQQALARYSEGLGNALVEYQRTGSKLAFDRAVKDAERAFNAEIHGTIGIIGQYVKKRTE